MIARIKTSDGFYDSIVFAIFNKGWKSEVIAFNRDYSALQKIRMYTTRTHLHRKVFIYNTEKDKDWLEHEKYEGYNWILEKVTKKFCKVSINGALLDKCKELQARVKNFDWLEIKNNEDVDGLMSASFGFHDSYVKDMCEKSGKQYILFDTTWGCDILFELDGNIETNLMKDYGHIAIGDSFPTIFDSAMFLENDLVYWVDAESTQSCADLDKSLDHYFYASRVKWQLIVQ